jgi:hypothetical protein
MTDRDPRLDSAYRATPREEPPVELDERIRAAARRAVSTGPQSLEARARAERSWIARWRVPVSLAATVVIVVTLTVMTQEEESRRARLDAPLNGPPPSPAAETAPPPEPEQEALPRDAQAAQRRPPPAAPAAREERAPAETQAPAKLESPAAAGTLSNALEKHQADVPAPVAPATQRAPSVPATPASVAPAAQPAPSTAPAPAMGAAPSGEASAPLSRERTLAERPGRADRSAAAPVVEAKRRTPEVWIEEIRRLRAQGRDADAAAELAEFRKRYPAYTLPDDLAR